MSNFKILVLVFCIMVASCFPKLESIDPPTYKTIVLDNCEYVYYMIGNSNFLGITHKGNCRFCTQRTMVPVKASTPKYFVHTDKDTTWVEWSPSKLKDHE